MKNHYEFVRDIRRRMRLAEQISPDDLIDYYWSLHRLHEHQTEFYEKHILLAENGQLKRLENSRDKHYRKSEEARKMATDFEEKAYPGLSGRIGEKNTFTENKDNYVI